MLERNEIRPQNCSTKRIISGQIKIYAISTDVSILAGRLAVFSIIKILVYWLCKIALFGCKVEIFRPCYTNSTRVHIIASKVIKVVRIASSCKISKIRNEHYKFFV